MKKAAAIIAAFTVLFSAANVNCEDAVTVELDGEVLSFDVPAQIIDGRTLVPLRKIFEELGAEIEWDGETQTVTARRDDTLISMTIGNNIMTVNSEEITLDVPPQIIDDRTLVPARAAAEGLGAYVDWDGETRTVIITSQNPSPSPTSEPTVSPTAAPTETPAPTAAAQEFPISYDNALERTVEYVSNFKLKSVTLNENGNYDIVYTLNTYFEGRGTVTVSFACLDSDGKEVDSFSGAYVGTDYTWTAHEDTAEISGKTVKIELKTTKK